MLNPMRSSLAQAGLAAKEQSSPFSERADAELAGFRALRQDLERQVRQGDLTVKAARERATAYVDRSKADLKQQAESFSPTPRAFLDRLVAATDARRSARESASLEALQRETNRLLRESIVEMQLVARRGEFEARSFLRPMVGGVPAPTLDTLLTLARSSTEAGDEVAREWSRRQLEALRPFVQEPDEIRRIDLACDRPDAVNPRLIETYLAAMAGDSAEARGIFLDRALEAGDANACIAAFLLARRFDPHGVDPVESQVTRRVLASLERFPDAALAMLRVREAEVRAGDAEAARAQADFAAARLDAESRLPGLEAPTAAEVDRASRMFARPAVQPGESIGLTLSRRGQMIGDIDLDAIGGGTAEADENANSFD